MSRLSSTALLCLMLSASAFAAEQDPPPAYSGGGSSLEIPDLSLIVDTKVEWNDLEHDDGNDGKIRLDHVELSLSGTLAPSIRGDFIGAFEQEYIDGSSETEVDVEEAYLTFLDLPLDLQATAGRRLVPFGRLNPVHSHHWPFADTPLVVAELVGDHAWYDDGLTVSWLVPNPADLYIQLSAGVWNGRELGHDHGHEEEAHDHGHEEEDHGHAHEDEHEHDEDHAHEDEHGHEEDHAHEDGHDHEEEGHGEDEHGHAHGDVIVWDDSVFTGRLFADLPLSDTLGLQLGASAALDEGERNQLLGSDLVVNWRRPNTYQRVRWHSEYWQLDDDARDTAPGGLFSTLQVTLDKHWEVGGRYDWTELLENDEETEWAGSGFLSYYLTHTTYLRGQYRYREFDDGEEENLFLLQLVWGIGPHSHRLLN